MTDTNQTKQRSKEKYRKDYSLPLFLLDNTKLLIQLFDENTTVHSKLEFTKNPNLQSDSQQSPELILNGENLILVDLKLDGVSLPRNSYQINNERLLISDLPNQFTLDITTKINPLKNTSLEGLYKSGNKFCTQCEAQGFRKITYYPDRPDVMSTFVTTVEADKNNYPQLLSNGNLIDSGELEDNRHFATWLDPHPKPCYLFALVAGDFDLLEDSYTTLSGREVALQIYVDKGKLNQCHYAIESLKNAMKWDEDVYGLEYDLDIYMIVAVSDFNMGAMENKGLNIFNTCYVLANDKTATDADFEGVESVIGHEYFHNWTGNRVTCRDWFQLSLKEGLTVFRDQEFSADMNSRSVKRVEDAQAIKNHQFAEDSGPMAHPIRPDSYIEMNNFYTFTVYNKGAEVIRMIQTIVSEQGFKDGIALYFKRHDGQAVTCEDFVLSMEDATNTDLSLFRNWYRQAGTPELTISSNWDLTKNQYTLNIEQDCPATPGQPHKSLFLIPLRVALFSTQGEKLDFTIDNTFLAGNKTSRAASSKNEIVININEHKQTIVFSGITSQPIPSLLRGFSAPVKLHYEYNNTELAMLLAHDDDSYSNWEAGQSLMINMLYLMIDDIKEHREISAPTILLNAFKELLNKENTDPNLLALTLKAPELSYIVEQCNDVLFDDLVSAYQHLNRSIAQQLKPELISKYQHALIMIDKDPGNASGWRSLRSACLSLLMKTDDSDVFKIAIKQFDNSTNMTTSLNALKTLSHSQYNNKAEVLSTFYKQWQDEELVLDKWFSVQATNPNPEVIDNIIQLLEHADFQLSNPNKVRALIAAFAKNNLINFHKIDGRGYKLVSDIIIKLNKLNPQIAARLTSSFNNWRNFDDDRKHLMTTELKRIIAIDNISPDVYEIASKALT